MVLFAEDMAARRDGLSHSFCDCPAAALPECRCGEVQSDLEWSFAGGRTSGSVRTNGADVTFHPDGSAGSAL